MGHTSAASSYSTEIDREVIAPSDISNGGPLKAELIHEVANARKCLHESFDLSKVLQGAKAGRLIRINQNASHARPRGGVFLVREFVSTIQYELHFAAAIRDGILFIFSLCFVNEKVSKAD